MGGPSRGNDMAAELKTLWVGDLDPLWDEAFLANAYSTGGTIVKTKIMKDGAAGADQVYGFVEFSTQIEAMGVLQGWNNHPIQGTTRHYRLNWAQHNIGEAPADAGRAEYSIFVGDLATEVTDASLFAFFQQYYPSTKLANVQTDTSTGHSKKYGFVRFYDGAEQQRALTEMNGQVLSGRPIRVGEAQPKTSQEESSEPAAEGESATVFVGNLGPEVREADLQGQFAQFEGLVSVRIPEGMGCGFVEYATAAAADQAIQYMNGQTMGSTQIRCERGKQRSGEQAAGGAAQDYSAYYAQQQQHGAQQADPWSAYYAAQANTAQPGAATATKQADFTKPVNVEEANSQYIEKHKPGLNIDVCSRTVWGMER